MADETLPVQTVRTGYSQPSATAGMVAGGAVGALGNIVSSGLNIWEARQNRKWQEKMANTAYQRQVVDMRKAGLNPMLAVTKGGGADTPAGSVGQASVGGEVGQAIGASAKANAFERPVMEATLDKISTERRATEQEMENRKALAASTVLVNAAQAKALEAQASQTGLRTERERKVGPWAAEYVPPVIYNWFQRTVGDVFGSGEGNAHGGVHSAKDNERRSR